MKDKLTENDIERYSTEHINYKFQSSESDIIYRMKNKELYFLIEHQRTIDYNMPKRILEYEVEIIKEATRGIIMTKQNHKLPTVYPIVIYTGSQKWKVEKYIKECQETLKGADRIKLGEYYIVDVNDYTNEELENDDLFLSKMLLLEKLKKEDDLFKTISRIVEKEKDKNNQSILKRIIAFILKEKIPAEDIGNLLKKLEEEEKDMVIEVVQRENERQRRMGIKQGRLEILKETVKNMLQLGERDEKIIKYIGISKKELEKIKSNIEL